VLLPLAIHACADLMDLFFPTLELKAEFEEQEEPRDAPDTEAIPKRFIEGTATMEHLKKKDLAWSAFDLTIQYSGPAELLVLEKTKKIYSRKLHFNKGVLEKIETLEGALEKLPLRLFIAAEGFPFETSFVAVLACFNNVGPGLGINGPTGNYAGFSGFTKLLLSMLMLTGRLEIYPVLMLFVPSFWKKR